MLAGTNTTSCTSSRGRSEFLAKITAGMAEAGGTETKQSQERGASGFQEAIWGEVGRNGSSSGDLSTILARAQTPGSPYPNTCQETLGGHCRWIRDAQHRTQAEAPALGPGSRLAAPQAGAERTLPGSCPTGSPALRRSRGTPSLNTLPLPPRPHSIPTFSLPQYGLPLTLLPPRSPA